MGVRPHFVWRLASLLSSRAVKVASDSCRIGIGICVFLSRCHRAVTTAILFGVDNRGDSRISAGECSVSGVDLDIGFFQNCGTTHGVPLEFQVETASS